MKKILFLCTGNYYRSRFSEEYFNALSKQHKLPWHSDSKGIMRKFEGNGNVGPIAQHTLDELAKFGIDAQGKNRFPEYFYENHFNEFDKIIAMSMDEHRPMLETLWPNHLDMVGYFDIEDLHLEGFDTALPRLKICLDNLLKNLMLENA